jgi:diguanylate cyclase (GGDEF)-like protein/PAS domain S-box-containing protein
MNRLRAYAPALIVSIVSVLFCVWSWHGLQQEHARELDEAQRHAELRVVQLDEANLEQLDATLRSVAVALHHLASVYIGNRADFDRAAHQVLAVYPPDMLQFVTVFGPDGYLAYASNGARNHIYFGDREHFRVPATTPGDAIFISHPIVGRLLGVPLIQITMAIRDGKRFYGVIGIPLRPDYLAHNLGALRVDPQDVLTIIRLDGVPISRSHALNQALAGRVPAARPYLHAAPGQSGLYRAVSAFDHKPMLFAWHRLADWPVVSVAAIDENSELAPLLAHQHDDDRNAIIALASIFASTLALAALIVWLQRKNALIQAGEQELRIAAVTFESQEGMVVTDAHARILKVNRAFTKITGYAAEEVVGSNMRMLRSGRHGSAFYARLWQAVRSNGYWSGEIWNRRRSGEIYPEWLTVTAVASGDGAISHYVGAFADITELKAAESEIRHLAYFDPLTGLPNRRLLLDRLRQAIAANARNGGSTALLFIDLDNFKTLNDSRGHSAGDQLLEQVAQRLIGCVREVDTVARLGGDEFVVMLGDLGAGAQQAATHAENVGEKILRVVNAPYALSESSYRISTSIGAAVVSGGGAGVEDFLKRADMAMYKAKDAGKNTIRFFDPEMQAVIDARVELEADLRLAIERGEIVVRYQPQVDAVGRVTGCEALARWEHPRRGRVGPDAFIGLAEETGLIVALGLGVLEIACAQLARWGRDPATAHLTVAVNVSARQFHHPDFVASVLAIVAQTGANPERLKLELTESLLLNDVDAVIEKMDAICAHGVRFSLDDFGTGYSSLYCLKRLPLYRLKIDKSFVSDILVDANDAAIAATIVALASHLRLQVIAEGVETDAQRDYLVELGCRAFQGFFVSAALPAAAFDALLRDRAGRGNAAQDVGGAVIS